MRNDPVINHKEDDNIIVQQVLRYSLEAKSITVMSDDTDDFVLLINYYAQAKLQVSVIMESPIKNRFLIDICETAKVYSKIVHDLLPAHGLSECDTATIYFGIGKGNLLKFFVPDIPHWLILGSSPPT